MSDVKKKVAVIGVGNMGVNHVRIYRDIADLVAVADTDKKRLKTVGEQTGVRTYEDYQAMLEKEALEAVSVVVPTKYHHQVASDVLEAGIPTLVEKPISNSVGNAAKLLKLSKQTGTHLTVGHVERFNPAVQHAKEMIRSKALGDIVSLLAVRVGIAPPQSKGSDVVIDLAVHDIDVFNFLLERFPQRATVSRKKIFSRNFSDVASVTVDYRKTTGMIQTNWITPIKMRKLYITGTEGFLEVDYIDQSLIHYEKSLNLKPVGEFFELVSQYSSTKKHIPIHKEEPLKRELEAFLANYTQEGPDPMCRSAIKALEIALESS